MSSPLPSLATLSQDFPKILIDGVGARNGADVIVASGQTDSGSDPTTRIRAGRVLVKRTSTGKYELASSATGDRCTPPVVTASETADADWASKTITLKNNGATVATVTLGGSDDTDAEVVTALNANAPFRAHAIATAAGSRVVITGLVGGAGESLEVTSNLTTAFGADGTSDSGEDADYRVLTDPVDLVSPTGAASDALGSNLVAGHFDESELLGLTAEAKVVLSRRGSRFG